MIQECKIPSAKPILMDFAFVTGQVLNSYEKFKKCCSDKKIILGISPKTLVNGKRLWHN